MPDISIHDPSVASAPKAYTITGSLEVVIKSVTGSFDGTSAAGSWVPAVQVVDPSGFVIGTFPAGQTLAAGASADVSWFPGIGAGTTSSGTRTLNVVIDEGGALIQTGVRGDVEIGFGCTITRWTLLADQSTSTVVDIWKNTYANYPPTVANSITSASPPTISAAVKAQSSTLTGWTTQILAGDTLRFNVNSNSAALRVTLALDLSG